MESQVLRVGLDWGRFPHTDEEVPDIMLNDRRATGTVYGPHFLIHFPHKQFVPTQVLLANAPGETAQ